jgi:Ca2+-transporting ATPase
VQSSKETMPSGNSRGTKNGNGNGRQDSSTSSNGGVDKGKNTSGQRSSSNDTRSRNHNDEQESNERTPLLNRDGQDDEHDNDNTGDEHSSSEEDGDNDQDTIVSNLGDFAIQPRDLANCLSDKDVDGLLKLASSSSNNNNNSQDGSSSSVQSLLEALQTDEKNGLSSDQCSEQGAEERIRVYGQNKLPEREMKSFWRFLWEAFCDKVLIILSVAAAVSFALGMWQDFGPQHDPDEPRVNWVEGVAISELNALALA